MRSKVFDRIQSLFVALSLAFLAWLYVNSRDAESLEHVRLPVDITLAPAFDSLYDLEVPGHSTVTASFRGTPARMRQFRLLVQEGTVRVATSISVPFEHERDDMFIDTVHIEPAEVDVPAGIGVTIAESSNHIPVTVRRIGERRLPVRVPTLAPGRERQLQIEPSTVLVRGPKVILDRARAVAIQPASEWNTGYEGADLETSVDVLSRLEAQMEGRPIQCMPDQVRVRTVSRPQEKTYDLTGLPIRILCPADFPFRVKFADEQRSAVSLRIIGPIDELPTGISVYLNLSGPVTAGPHADEPLGIQLPPRFRLVGQVPHSGSFALVPPAKSN